jgi:hypothetical protein
MPGPGRPFQKGGDPRRAPGGLPEGYAEFRKACASFSQQAVGVLVEALKDDDGRVRIKAAEVLLERAWGKAAAAPEDLEALRESSPLAAYTKDEVLAIATSKGEP